MDPVLIKTCIWILFESCQFVVHDWIKILTPLGYPMLAWAWTWLSKPITKSDPFIIEIWYYSLFQCHNERGSFFDRTFFCVLKTFRGRGPIVAFTMTWPWIIETKDDKTSGLEKHVSLSKKVQELKESEWRHF